MHYHGIDVENVGYDCPAAWVDSANKAECCGCDSFRYHVFVEDAIEFFTTKYPTDSRVVFAAAFGALSKATPNVDKTDS